MADKPKDNSPIKDGPLRGPQKLFDDRKNLNNTTDDMHNPEMHERMAALRRGGYINGGDSMGGKNNKTPAELEKEKTEKFIRDQAYQSLLTTINSLRQDVERLRKGVETLDKEIASLKIQSSQLLAKEALQTTTVLELKKSFAAQVPIVEQKRLDLANAVTNEKNAANTKNSAANEAKDAFIQTAAANEKARDKYVTLSSDLGILSLQHIVYDDGKGGYYTLDKDKKQIPVKGQSFLDEIKKQKEEGKQFGDPKAEQFDSQNANLLNKVKCSSDAQNNWKLAKEKLDIAQKAYDTENAKLTDITARLKEAEKQLKEIQDARAKIDAEIVKKTAEREVMAQQLKEKEAQLAVEIEKLKKSGQDVDASLKLKGEELIKSVENEKAALAALNEYNKLRDATEKKSMGYEQAFNVLDKKVAMVSKDGLQFVVHNDQINGLHYNGLDGKAIKLTATEIAEMKRAGTTALEQAKGNPAILKAAADALEKGNKELLASSQKAQALESKLRPEDHKATVSVGTVNNKDQAVEKIVVGAKQGKVSSTDVTAALKDLPPAERNAALTELKQAGITIEKTSEAATNKPKVFGGEGTKVAIAAPSSNLPVARENLTSVANEVFGENNLSMQDDFKNAADPKKLDNQFTLAVTAPERTNLNTVNNQGLKA